MKSKSETYDSERVHREVSVRKREWVVQDTKIQT